MSHLVCLNPSNCMPWTSSVGNNHFWFLMQSWDCGIEFGWDWVFYVWDYISVITPAQGDCCRYCWSAMKFSNIHMEKWKNCRMQLPCLLWAFLGAWVYLVHARGKGGFTRWLLKTWREQKDGQKQVYYYVLSGSSQFPSQFKTFRHLPS